MAMKFYGTGTPNVQRAALPLFLADVDMEKEVKLVKVNLMARQHMSPAYKSKQIFGVVPYLEDDGVGIHESRAIARYIAEKYKADLLGSTRKEKAIIDAWMESEAQSFSPTIAPILKDFVMSKIFNKPSDPEVVSTNLEKLRTVLDVYEGHLSKHKYLAGERYTLADAFHTPFVEKVRTMDVFEGVLDDRTHVAAWASDITSLPAFKKCLEMDWENATPLE